MKHHPLNIHAPKQMIQHNGLWFEVHIETDYATGYPWDEVDGHGGIRSVSGYGRTPSKRAGEVVLHTERRTAWLYDVQAAQKTALADAWGCRDATTGLSKRQIAAKAVQENMDYCRKWLKGYIYQIYLRVCTQDQAFEDCLGGVECGSGYNDKLEQHVTDTVYEMADNVYREWLEHGQKSAQTTIGCIPLVVSDELSNALRDM